MSRLNDLYDSIVGLFSPAKQVQNIQMRKLADDLKSSYEAGAPSRLHKQRTDRGSADSAVSGAGESIRTQARHLEQNMDLASNVLDILVDNVVGTGIRPDPQVLDVNGRPHKEFNKAIRKLWKEWIKDPEVTGGFDCYSAQRLCARTLFRDGEYLLQHIEGLGPKVAHGTRIPYSFEMIEPDYLPIGLTDVNKRIVQGVEKNGWGRPTYYHLHREHPGDSYYYAGKTLRRSAKKITHVKLVSRMGQTRGVSVFASVINRLDDIKEIEESERVAARVAAALTAYIKKGSPDSYNEGADSREMEMSPGMIADDLLPGEDIGIIKSDRPNVNLIPFLADQKRSLAGGVGTSYSSLAKEYNGNYSSRKQEASEQYVHYGALWQHFVSRHCQATYERFVKMSMLIVDIPRDVDIDTLFNVEHSRPSLVSLEPLKEANAASKLLDLGLTSKSKEIRKRGDNPEDVRSQRVLDYELDKEDGELIGDENEKLVPNKGAGKQ